MANLKDNVNDFATENHVDAWFSKIVDHIKVDHLLMSTDTAPEETKNFYNLLINGNEGEAISEMRKDSSMYFIKKILFEYLSEIRTFGALPLKLALGISDSKLLVWSEIEDDDEKMEDILLLAEAKVNGKYHKNGFYINSTIIEKSDNIPVPNHYQNIIA